MAPLNPLLNAPPPAAEKGQRADRTDYGSVEGRLEVIQDQGALQIWINDRPMEQMIKCRLTDGLLAGALKNFRRRVEVSGLIDYGRDGEILGIKAERIDALPDDSDLPAAEDVRGILSGYV